MLAHLAYDTLRVILVLHIEGSICSLLFQKSEYIVLAWREFLKVFSLRNQVYIYISSDKVSKQLFPKEDAQPIPLLWWNPVSA